MVEAVSTLRRRLAEQVVLRFAVSESDPEAANLHLLEPENDLDVEIADVSELLCGASRLTGLDPQYRAARALDPDRLLTHVPALTLPGLS